MGAVCSGSHGLSYAPCPSGQRASFGAAAAEFQRSPCVSSLFPLCSLWLVGQVPACECRAASVHTLLCLLRQTRQRLRQRLPRPPCPDGHPALATAMPHDCHGIGTTRCLTRCTHLMAMHGQGLRTGAVGDVKAASGVSYPMVSWCV